MVTLRPNCDRPKSDAPTIGSVIAWAADPAAIAAFNAALASAACAKAVPASSPRSATTVNTRRPIHVPPQGKRGGTIIPFGLVESPPDAPPALSLRQAP